MLDNDNDKSLVWNQLIVIILMSVLLFVWFQFFMPKQPPVQQPAPVPTAETEQVPREPVETAHRTDDDSAVHDSAWPYLPAQAEPSDRPEDDEVILENEWLRLVFTRIGGRIKRCYAKLSTYREEEIQFVPLSDTDTQDLAAPYPMGITFTHEDIGSDFNTRMFDVEILDAGQEARFTLTTSGCVLEKRFRLGATPYTVDFEVEFTPLEISGAPSGLGLDETPSFWLTWQPNVKTYDIERGQAPVILLRQASTNREVVLSKLPKEPVRRVFNPEWIALKSAYFVVALKPDYDQSQAIADGNPERFRFGLGVPPIRLSEENEPVSYQFQLYAGPRYHEFLAAAWPTLDSASRIFSARWDFMDKFAKLLLGILNFFYNHVYASYGLAIIFVTIIIRMLLFPLTYKSMKSMKRMQALGPEVAELRKKYADNPSEMNKKMMEFYKERGVNPLGGCLPMVLQLPVFIAFYRMLWSAYELRGAPFMLIPWLDWISDLSQPDKLLPMPFMEHVPFIGATFEYLNVLPILMALSIYFSQKMMPASSMQNDQQRIIMNIMPIFMGFVCYRMAAGLNLYILTSTGLGILQNKLMTLSKTESPSPKPQPKPKPKRNFYAAAQERKRRFAKESKTAKKSASAQRKGGSGTSNN